MYLNGCQKFHLYSEFGKNNDQLKSGYKYPDKNPINNNNIMALTSWETNTTDQMSYPLVRL